MFEFNIHAINAIPFFGLFAICREEDLQFWEANFVWEFVDRDFYPILDVLRVRVSINSYILEVINEIFIDRCVEIVKLFNDILSVDTRERHVFEEFNLEGISNISSKTVFDKCARTLIVE